MQVNKAHHLFIGDERYVHDGTGPKRQGFRESGALAFTTSVGGPLSPTVRLAQYDNESKHNIAGPFWQFLNRTGKVLDNGRYVDRPVFGDWVFVMGRPISEPYWARINIGCKAEQWSLVQLFERRVLTYTPSNAPDWQVEMGNVGLHYYVWRYGDK